LAASSYIEVVRKMKHCVTTLISGTR
jgi:hypothetical protein